VRALRQREPRAESLGRYETVAKLLTGSPTARLDQGAEWVGRLTRELKIPPLGVYGIRSDVLDELVEKSAKASSMKANPIVLAREELREILQRAL
jgi:alcohol dehydrogenase class IV